MSNASSRIHDLKGMSNGLALVFRSAFESQSKQAEHYVRSFVVPDVEYFRMQLENAVSDRLRKTPMENVMDARKKVETLFTQSGALFPSPAGLFNQSNFFWFTQKRAYYVHSRNLQIARPISLPARSYYSTTTLQDNKSNPQATTTATGVKVSTANVAKFRNQVKKAI